MPARILLALLVGAYLVFLGLRIPASIAVPVLQEYVSEMLVSASGANTTHDEKAGVFISGISGTLWAGEASEVRLNGQPLGEFRWHVRPLHFLIGNYTNHFENSNRDLNFNGAGDFTIGFGSTTLANAEYEGEVDDIISLFDMELPYEINGSIKGDIDIVRLNADGAVVETSAEIDFSGLRLKKTQELGDIRVSVSQAGESPFVLDIRSSAGSPLDVQGSMEVHVNGDANVDLEFRLLSNAGEAGALLKLISKDEGGRHVLRWRGNLVDLF